MATVTRAICGDCYDITRAIRGDCYEGNMWRLLRGQYVVTVKMAICGDCYEGNMW